MRVIGFIASWIRLLPKVRPYLLIMVLLLFQGGKISGQNVDIGLIERETGRLFAELAVTRDNTIKDRINDSIIDLLTIYSGQGDVFSHKFESIKYLGQITASDSLVKMVTWNLFYNNGDNRYLNFVFYKCDDSVNYTFLDGSKGLRDVTIDSLFDRSSWYGALYYDIEPFVSNGDTLYIALGIDFNDMFTNSKVIEVINFNADGDISFGSPVIVSANKRLNRLLFRYSSNASMLLRFDNLRTRIVFDHLSPASPGLAGQYQYYGPDFSYDGLILREGKWLLQEDIDVRNRK